MLTSLMLIVGVNSYAGSWVPPTAPTGKAPASGDTVMLYNVNMELYLTSGKVNALWESSTILGPNGLSFRLDQDPSATDESGNPSWTITTASGGYAGKYMFAPTAEGDMPHCFCDMAGTWQGAHRWDIEQLPNGNYTLSLNPVHGMAVPGTYFGSNGQDNDLYWNINPEETPGCQIEWIFITKDLMDAYQAKKTLYDVLYEAEDAGVNTDEASAVYNNPESTLAEVNQAINALKSAMASTGFDPDASEDNPQDISELIVNPTFDENVDGWENINGMTWIASAYTGNNSEINAFCEKWTWDAHHSQHYGIYQDVNLPKGHYRLEADALATCQSNGGLVVTGVSLFATTQSDYRVAVATGNNDPHHYTIDFMSDGSVATRIGFNCEATTTANWIAVDNFALYYLGQSEVSEAYFRLNNALSNALSTYPEDDMNYVDANQSVKEAYIEVIYATQAVLENRDSEDAVYASAQRALEDAIAALDASVKAYKELFALVDKCSSLIDELNVDHYDLAPEVEALSDEIVTGYSEQSWGSEEIADITNRYNVYVALKDLILYCDSKMEAYGDDVDLVGMIEDRRMAIEEAWHAGTFATLEAVATEKEAIEQMITEYVNSRLQPDTDITAMIENAGFDNGATGWTQVVDKTPTISEGVAEVYQGAFDIQQTLRNMPKGRYTLSVQAFQRCGWGLSGFGNEDNIALTLYANENTKKCHHIGDFCSAEGYYVDPSGENGYPYDSYDAERGYYPNSMTGAAAAFAKSPDTYKTTLDFFLLGESKQDLTIGLRNDRSDGGWWCLFDNFTLYYHGNNASDYIDGLNELIAKLEATIDGEAITIECQNKVDTAIENAKTAIDTKNADACVESLDELKETIAFAEQTVALTQKLSNDYSLIVDYRMEGISSGDTDYENVLADIVAALFDNRIADAEELAEYEEKLQSGFTAYVQHDGLTIATEEDPFDITPVIYNYDGIDLLSGEYNTAGWQTSGNSAANEYGTEFYNNDFTLEQTIYGLAPGYYKLHVQGFYRQGWPGQNVDTCANYVDLHAGEFHTHLLNIYDDWRDAPLAGETTVINVDTLGTKKYVPNSMQEACAYFDAGLYRNTLVFQVAEGQKATIIGLSKGNTIAGDWCIFDNWSLDYVGTAVPTEESTAVENIEAGQMVAISYFSIDGKQLARPAKGINIVRTTDQNGHARVSKVMVK